MRRLKVVLLLLISATGVPQGAAAQPPVGYIRLVYPMLFITSAGS